MHGANVDQFYRGRATSPVYRASHDPDGAAEVSTTVAHALADCLGVDVTEAATALAEHVDGDALDALFRSPGAGSVPRGTTLSFPVRDHLVTVRGDGEILIDPPTDPFYGGR